MVPVWLPSQLRKDKSDKFVVQLIPQRNFSEKFNEKNACKSEYKKNHFEPFISKRIRAWPNQLEKHRQKIS